MSRIKSRDQALKDGDKTYFTGKPCKRGHAAPRYASGGQCAACTAGNLTAWRRRSSQRAQALYRASYRRRKERDPGKVARLSTESSRRYAERHPERNKESKRAWKRRNMARVLAETRARQARLQERLCACCPASEFFVTYELARMFGCEVDHKLALGLGGLHCVKNLQLLTPKEHRQKTKRDMLEIRKRRKTA